MNVTGSDAQYLGFFSKTIQHLLPQLLPSLPQVLLRQPRPLLQHLVHLLREPLRRLEVGKLALLALLVGRLEQHFGLGLEGDEVFDWVVVRFEWGRGKGRLRVISMEGGRGEEKRIGEGREGSGE